MKYLLLAITLLATQPALAEDESYDPGLDEDRKEELMEMRLERMTEQLGLTEEQQEEIREIMEEHRQKMEKEYGKVRDNIDDVLTPDQRQKMQEWREDRRERFREFREKRREKLRD